jgi:phosphopantetheinyl transferase
MPHIPGDVAVGIAPCRAGELSDPGHRSELSLDMFRKLARLIGLDDAGLRIEKEEGGRPRLYAGNVPHGASIAHTKGMLACAVRLNGMVGLDIERADRAEHPSLRPRMLSKGDDPELIRASSTITLWTIKESVLKLYGSGLRVPMNTVSLKTLQNDPEGLIGARVNDMSAIVATSVFGEFRIALAWPADD